MDKYYMQQALTIAQYAIGRTSPNPLVGAVIVKDGHIVGQGWHHQAGTPHAEIHALAQASELAKGATIYVTLEPCSHHGRTGPCADALIAAGIKKVVAAMTDPNPEVAGKGLTRLREAGIEVVEGILAAEAAKLNEVFIKWITTKMPFGVLKTAMSLDGKIAAYTGHSKWITGPVAREYVHRLRDIYDGILVGIGTVLTDNPRLTTRLPAGGQNPVRIIIDTMARTPLTANVITDKQAPTIIAVSQAAPPERIAALQSHGVEVLVLARSPLGVDLRQLFTILGERRITSVFVEGGAAINASLLAANLIDKVYCFIAPKILGGKAAPGPVGGIGVETVDQAILLEDIATQTIGTDVLLNGYITGREGRNVYRTCGGIRES
ncbi:bifunctional diaminohydroxyphosphoribosylaminopyrimidine deaminase/5-amino-6-(5-phosphoribosylamino)uracil reductase RibD [Sporomusa sp. KB1]|jgi:diaminohydroxyphosphoribosylaminopyrimidine deaminase/5-amino-6-(5-phosphoribosylamino)uracil reductase|uniref:bifunctional diaminohydroxyphosphoribosylaminopyrimidine deaminase/5-amino-6-(5-phosphoribosylamino)uracil reductase RibD n=1 Tax=Sporomusa sp. KB1 TaxID=943346 RepID=UPI00119E54CB|nr:bifunctional diaminohydroxyphosphoribosylaminopyrimidine deaminase/5-amino-6-(5-phosphoribosylamino)uracil reductase RibD [Sporomusa sp. KB1]TWH49092.1 diaminohydroxyphosphoribosylaminopyrimidine deaminase [Sporomusa sp. KB1]